MIENRPEYWRLFRGETVRQSVVEAENPIGMENVKKGIQLGQVIGQGELWGDNRVY